MVPVWLVQSRQPALSREHGLEVPVPAGDKDRIRPLADPGVVLLKDLWERPRRVDGGLPNPGESGTELGEPRVGDWSHVQLDPTDIF
jgi:hypothetical protein